jgi:uncharacterized protein (TIGR02421 family)
MERLSDPLFDKAVLASKALDKAAGKLRILSSIAWDEGQKKAFLDRGKQPDPNYAQSDTGPARELISAAKEKVQGTHEAQQWLQRIAETLTITANLIDSRGTPEFFDHSVALYGQPTRLMIDKTTKVLDLAHHMDEALDGLDFDRLVIEGCEVHLSDVEFAEALRSRLDHHFAQSAPRVEISEGLSAKASAGRKRIRIRKGASFTERDVDQLLHHEALIHAATAMNGRAQTQMSILGRGHAGTTEVQEGLAVFAEMITGAMDPRRFRRLSGRVLAIQMAVEGADFKEVFDFFIARGVDRDQAYENSRRVFRGGVISGGAPFTKDIVYLNGLLRVHNFMRTVVKMGRADLIRILFLGKMDIEDVPALAQLASNGRLDAPKFLPPWVEDLRFLVSYMGYSSFLNRVKIPGFQAYYAEELKGVPDVWGLMG